MKFNVYDQETAYAILDKDAPYITKNAIDYKLMSFNQMLVYLKDGTRVIYDIREGLIRNAPADPDNLTDDEFAREFSINLRAMLRIRGITQNKLSAVTGITPALISHYVTRQAVPGAISLYKLAKALDCDIADLLYSED